jgi:hypothetical protein
MRFTEIAGEEFSCGFGRLDYWVANGWRAEPRKILVNGSPKTGTTAVRISAKASSVISVITLKRTINGDLKSWRGYR